MGVYKPSEGLSTHPVVYVVLSQAAFVEKLITPYTLNKNVSIVTFAVGWLHEQTVRRPRSGRNNEIQTPTKNCLAR